ncbi:GntR family transcriptional repressor for pyruvate dehydrogenase complex [Rhodococcus sp. LBL1]|uniref:GntR family transcriptional repressor for pyruvate dehydrogenase complex n=2 Tax=Prescottella agglutinans TaxID=1644129 RepID=A0ABT6ML15_9NOCA|nr:GntR family transcriptional repressor for pyruvate dehydrogenase complex [Prescottella agglutinans]MDH6679208.1 GntR family transcriptional repressor for pyruvate dehydrogenase complex [Rhodococcus sp. LBL1]MDH6685052.1 GntR family transcriptional repressor for pyruvate dehydrogenase complex [Rhodococcus sp. LBL2]
MSSAVPKPARNGRSSIQLTPMEVPKASDVLANELRERILSGEFAEGTPLPPERELVVQTKMSRTTVREALRILEVQGLVRIKAGRAGGAFVQRPGEQSMADTVALLIRGRQIRLAALLETREAIEPFCAQLAARHRTEEDLARLDAANDAITAAGDQLDAFLQANIDWHVAVASASHNELLSGLMISLSRAIYAATENEGFVDEKVRAITARAHRSVTKAIRDKDADAAVRRMTRHVHSYAKSIQDFDKRTDIPLDD